MPIKLNWDNLGIFTSILCAIHCTVLPVLMTSLPVLGVNIIHNLFFEWGMIFLAIGIGIYSLYHGYKKHHHSLLPIGLFGLGAVCLILKQFNHASENWFLIPAVVLIITAHYQNYRLCHKAVCKSTHHSH